MSGSMRDLHRRIRSISSTQQMTRAMRTVAVAKYSRAQATARAFEPYRAACERLLRASGGWKDEPRPVRRVCYVAVAANRGLCGSYNLELGRYLAGVLAEEKREYSVVLCGRWLRDNAAGLGIGGVIHRFELPDVPDYDHALELTRYLRDLWEREKADRVVFVTQRFRNVLTRSPGLTPFLPFGAAGEGGRDEYLFVPDRKSILPGLEEQCLTSQVYGLLLSAAQGAHGAMLVAMRQASDNSQEMLDRLKLEFNRMRQAAVTTEVLELTGGTTMRDSEAKT